MTTELNNEFVSDTTCLENYGKGWKVIFATFGVLLVVTLIYVVIRAPLDASNNEEDGSGGLGLLAPLYGIFLVGPIGMSTAWVFLKAARKEEIRITDMFSVFQRNYWHAVGAGILKFIVVLVGIVLLVVPGLFLMCRLAFVEYLIVDRKMKVGEAFSTSWSMTQGHGWTLFGMFLLAIPIFIAGLLALIVGIFPALMWIYAAFAVLYHSVELKEGIPGTGGPAALPEAKEPAAG